MLLNSKVFCAQVDCTSVHDCHLFLVASLPASYLEANSRELLAFKPNEQTLRQERFLCNVPRSTPSVLYVLSVAIGNGVVPFHRKSLKSIRKTVLS